MSAEHLGRVHTLATCLLSLLSHHQDHEDNNKDITAKSLLCLFHLLSLPALHLILSQVEAELDDTISVLKEKIAADQGHPVASQKIIFSGISTCSLHRAQSSPEQNYQRQSFVR